jgi:16S rRNA (adenine1518-N6/adenine1519-N6)-dimethyltransferase
MKNKLLISTQELLQNLKLDPNQVNYGQHFLIDKPTADLFIKALSLNPEDLVLEIGPGLGTLTGQIVKQAKQLTAVDIDKRFKLPLQKLEEKYPNLNVQFKNILEWQNFNYDKICGALSYSIFEPLLKQLYTNIQFEKAVFIISKKFMEEYNNQNSVLSQIAQAFFKVEFIKVIEKEKFFPAPRFSGVLVALTPRKQKNMYQFVLSELYLQSDKKLKNSLREALISWYKHIGKTLTKKQAKEKFKPLLNNSAAEKTIWQAGKSYLRQITEYFKVENKIII